MVQAGSWYLNPEIKTRNAAVSRMAPRRKDGHTWYTLFSKFPPQPFSVTFKGAKVSKVKVKIKKSVLAMKADALE